MNCQISDFFSFTRKSSLVSFINVLKPYFANIGIDNCIFQRVFFNNGILFTNYISDSFYINVNDRDIFNYLENRMTFYNNFNFSLTNSIISEYNLYGFQNNTTDLFSVFDYDFLPLNSCSINILFINNSILNTYHSNNISEFSLIFLNYINLDSCLSIENCLFTNNWF